MLDLYFWGMVDAFLGHKDVSLPKRVVHSWIIEEYVDALEWLEEMKA